MVTPSFSIGTTATTSPAIARRSTRRAAMIATTRIAEELAPQRRSTRMAMRSNDSNHNSVRTSMVMSGGTTAATTSASTRFATATASSSSSSGGASARTPELPPAPKGSPIVLDDDDIESMDLKPAAKVSVAEVAAALLPVQMADFTCAICLDAPTSMTDVASISGCTHQFCFDCIDKWANTENRCPCCKARFRTIDRVIALPTSPIETLEQAASTRKGKRKRTSYSGSPYSRRRSGESNASASSPGRPNSRTVEDRNQPSIQGIVIDAAFVQNILSTLMDATSGGRGGGEPLAVVVLGR